MKRIDRFTAILLQLQTKRILPGKEIAARFGICLRTVHRDIRAPEDAGVPTGSEPGLGHFLAPGYHLPPVMFTDAVDETAITHKFGAADSAGSNQMQVDNP
jgi:predicted DNA-binding transcriptional regulator YafY